MNRLRERIPWNEKKNVFKFYRKKEEEEKLMNELMS